MPTNKLADLLKSSGLAAKSTPAEARTLRTALNKLSGLEVYPASVTGVDGAVLAMAREGLDRRLLVLAPAGNAVLGRFVGQDRGVEVGKTKQSLRVCPLDAANAASLRQVLPFTAPTIIGLRTSVGMGDRLGLGTPGHVLAVEGSGMMPFFAQQSIREMTRTQRTAQQVMDDASFGVLQAGWREGFGSDADHLKTTADIDVCAKAGFTMYTIDPGEHVDNAAGKDDIATLRAKYESLPWADLGKTAHSCRADYLTRPFTIEGIGVWEIKEEELLRAACKYGKAIAHTVKLSRHLDKVMGAGRYEIEMSVDETDSPTTPMEHFFVANELKGLGVKFSSLAPRFIGKFEKGVDYQGNLAEFERQFAQHAAIARHVGPYKISIHSGSDKFLIYPIVAKYTQGLVHLKTAGTSYLEAIRVIAKRDAALFREIMKFAIDRYETDKASYHVSAELSKVASLSEVPDDRLVSYLDDFHARQVLHVTFGSVLTTKKPDGSYLFRDRLYADFNRFEADYDAYLCKHLGRHVRPFAKK
jgi:tagaturonate epimerase